MPMPGSLAVRDVILYRALRLAQVTGGPGRSPSPDQQQDALLALNGLIESLSIQPDAILGLSSARYTLVPGQQVYTIGRDPIGATTADFDAPAPVRIEEARLLISGSSATFIPINLITAAEWADIEVPGISSAIPTALYCDYDAPLSGLHFWPVPSSGNDIELWTWHTQAQFETGDDIVVMRPAYADMYVYQLAVRMADQFATPAMANPSLQSTANKLLGRIKAFNSPSPPIGSVDAGTSGGGGGYFNWMTGGPA